VTSAGVFAAGVISRHSSAGALRIVGNQTLRDGQRIRIEIDSNNQPQSVEVTDTLALGNEAQQGVVATTVSNGLDVVWPAGFDPGSDAITLLTTGQVTGRFADATGLYGFTDGSTYLALTTEASGEITVSETLRPAASQLGIEAHEKSDADTLGVFFNGAYFGYGATYEVGMTITAADFFTADGRFTLNEEFVGADLINTQGRNAGSLVDAQRWMIGGSGLNGICGTQRTLSG